MIKFSLRTGLAIFFSFFVFLSASLSAQVDSSTRNIKANLTKVDTTFPAVYNIKPLQTIIIGAAATAANMIAINNVLHNKKNLSPQEVEALRPDIVNGFDR